MLRVSLNPERVWKPKAPFSQGVKVEGRTLIFTSGQVGFDKNGQLVGKGDIRAQARQAMENVKAVLEEAGARLDNVVKITTFPADMADYPAFNEVRNAYFTTNKPASTAVKAELVSKDLLVEIEAVAVIE